MLGMSDLVTSIHIYSNDSPISIMLLLLLLRLPMDSDPPVENYLG